MTEPRETPPTFEYATSEAARVLHDAEKRTGSDVPRRHLEIADRWLNLANIIAEHRG